MTNNFDLSTPTQDERLLAAFSHLSVLLSVLQPGIGSVIPIIIWLVQVTKKDRSQYVTFQSFQVIIYQVCVTAIQVIAHLLYGIAIRYIDYNFYPPPVTGFRAYQIISMMVPIAFLIVKGMVTMYAIWGAIMTFQGKPFRYWMIGNQIERFMPTMNQNPSRISVDGNTLQQAASLYKQGDKPQAAMLLSGIVRQDPNNSLAWYGLALSLEEPDKKIFCLKKVISLEPSHKKAKQLLMELQPKSKPLPFDFFQESLLILAWLLFIICMFLPQGGIGEGIYSTDPVNGSAFIVNGLSLSLLSIFYPLVPIVFPPAVAILISELLFLGSPFILWGTRRRLNKRMVWQTYTVFNFVSTIVFLWAIRETPMVNYIDPYDVTPKLLPGYIVWIIAEITLTMYAFVKYLQARRLI